MSLESDFQLSDFKIDGPKSRSTVDDFLNNIPAATAAHSGNAAASRSRSLN